LEEITKFLEDYDLHWGGGPGPQDMTYPHGPEDMELFMRKIVELNDYASRNKPSLKLENNIARVAFEKPILITLSNDSFSIDNGNPRPYNLPLSVQFFKDIFEGLYPMEFKEKHPDGVSFKIDDKRQPDTYKGKAKFIQNNGNSTSFSKDSIGKGDGKLTIRIPPKSNQEISIE